MRGMLPGAAASVQRVAGARGWTDDPTPELTVRRHRDIVAALRARDVEGAQRAMSEHFRGIEARAATGSADRAASRDT